MRRSDGSIEREARFRAVYADAYPDLLRFVSRRVHPGLAEDVVADTFLAAWRRLDDVPVEPGKARAWLFGTARRSLLNEQRGARRREALAVRIAEFPDHDQYRALDPDQIAARMDLAASWHRLTPAEQEVLALTAWDGLTSAEAASVMGISPVAYRIRLSRSRRALRHLLDHQASFAPSHGSPIPEGHSR